MRRFRLVVLVVITVVTLISVNSYAQSTEDSTQTQGITTAIPNESSPESKSQAAQEAKDKMASDESLIAMSAPISDVPNKDEVAIYGEVGSVDALGGSLLVQYYDYDSDDEKTINAFVDSNTKLENVVSLNEIKQGDWVDLTYVFRDGKNIANSIVVEKEEMTPSQAPANEQPGTPEGLSE